METVSFIIAVVALVIAVLAYMRTGGIQDLRTQLPGIVHGCAPIEDGRRVGPAGEDGERSAARPVPGGSRGESGRAQKRGRLSGPVPTEANESLMPEVER